MLFQQLDALVTFALIMLILSVFITSLVQFVVSVLGLRGRNLRWGVSRLLEQMDPRFRSRGGPDASSLANRLLTHPTLAPARQMDGSVRPVTAIEPRDLVRLLDTLRSEGALDSASQEVVDRLLQTENVGFEGEQMARLDRVVDGLKRTLPERHAAIESAVTRELGEARKVVHMLDDWFDSVMDATTERFKLWTRWITVTAAVLLTVLFQVDSSSLFRQLTGDPSVTAAVLAQAAEGRALYDDLAADAGRGVDAVERTELVLQKSRVLLEATGIDVLDPIWRDGWSNPFSNAAGKILTIFLLSLGAPFWYGTLAKLLNLRSVVNRRMEPSGRS